MLQITKNIIQNFSIVLMTISAMSYADDFIFDKRMLNISGISYSGDVDNDDTFYQSGDYRLDIYLNNKKITQKNVKLIRKDKKLTPLLAKEIFNFIPLKKKHCQEDTKISYPVAVKKCIPEASVKLQMQILRLDISIPQSLLVYYPDDYIPDSEFDVGSTVFFTNYTINQYYSRYSTAKMRSASSSSGYVGLSSGLNLGRWQLRQQSNISKSLNGKYAWKAANVFIKRPIPKIKSELYFGQLNTDGSGSFSFNGVSLQNDQQMIPVSLRGYAPQVTGQARTNAKVSVFQGSKKIYETSVPPGRFELNNIVTVSSQDQLRVLISESDGSQSSYIVPISNLSDSLRKGRFNYNVNIGRLRDYSGSNLFSQFAGRYGFNNLLTGNGGFLVGSNYHSSNMGVLYVANIGAIGTDITWSDATLKNSGKQQGWMMNVTYNKNILPTQTNIGFAGYKYSTRGYRDFQDVIAINNGHNPVSSFDGGRYLQKNRLQLTLSQPLSNYGTVAASVANQNYYDGRSKDTSYQISYNKFFTNGINFSLSLIRQNQLRHIANHHSYTNKEAVNVITRDRIVTFSLSIPLNNTKYGSSISTDYQSDDMAGESLNTSLSGSSGGSNNISWGMGFQKQNLDNTLNGSMAASLPYSDISATVSHSQSTQQVSTTLMGSVVAHSGGITFGHNISDTFGIIEVKNGKGAIVMNNNHIMVDRFGYAILPSLTPYSRNNVNIEMPIDKHYDVDIVDGSATVIPYSGAAVKLKFKTISGKAVMLQLKDNNGQYLPFGTEVYNVQGEQLGLVGQGGNVYLRISDDEEKLVAKIDATHSCTAHFPLGKLTSSDPIIFINSTCQ